MDSTTTCPAHAKRTALFLQDECLKHRFIRSRDTADIYERPERLHALKLGLAAALSRIEEAQASTATAATVDDPGDDLAAVLEHMVIHLSGVRVPGAPRPRLHAHTTPVVVRRTTASVSLLDHAAVKYVHGDVEKDVYLENLVAWARDSQANIARKGTEIPEGIPPLDLYLCPESIDAIQGAVGAVCEAVDATVAATRGPRRPAGGQDDDACERAFVAIRPPGHHCGEDTPSGFCFVNNVAVGAAHAHLNHGIQRIVILDIDLHHGNGTQSIVWQINDETFRQTLEAEVFDLDIPLGPRIFYGSLHDILSFPCEEGEPDLVQAASTSIHGPHGQYIENIHLEKYASETHFWDDLYPRYLALLHRAREFLDETGGPGDDVMVFISCGFDAGEHEYPSMSRHDRRVPVGFYHRFTRETCQLADAYARGRVVSVLEGGYSDRALTSGAMAHLCGLVDPLSHAGADGWIDDAWWSEANLVKLEKAARPRISASARASMEGWLVRTFDLFSTLSGADVEKGPMTLRERRKPVVSDGAPPDAVRTSKHKSRGSGRRSASASAKLLSAERPGTGRGETRAREGEPGGPERKKLPRVTLHVRTPEAG